MTMTRLICPAAAAFSLDEFARLPPPSLAGRGPSLRGRATRHEYVARLAIPQNTEVH